MFPRNLRFLLWTSALLSLFFACAELPTDPMLISSNSSVSLFLKDGGDPVVDFGTTREIGFEIRLTHLMDSARVYSEYVAIDTVFPVDSTKPIDTLWFNPQFTAEGHCIITAEATMRDTELKNKSDTLSIHVLTTNPGIHFFSIPQEKTIPTGKPDTLFFVTGVTGNAAMPASYILAVAPETGAEFFTAEYSTPGDTARIIATPSTPGTYSLTLIATTQLSGTTFADTAAVTVNVISSSALSTIHAPQQLIAGNADTLLFAVDNSTRQIPLTITLISESPLDPSVFTILPTGPDTIMIAIAATATTTANNIGIITSNGTESDTSRYPITLISPEATLWNTTSLSQSAVEGALFTLDLSQYLSAANAEGVALSADVGTIENATWSFTPPWGSAEIVPVTVTAAKDDLSLTLTLNLTVAAGDTKKPVVSLVDPALDGKTVGSSELTVECNATDAGAGIGSVVFTSGTQQVPATLQGENVYSGAITGLVHGTPTQITITATDKSRMKNSEQLMFTVTRDSTILDMEPPVIKKKAGPESGSRVLSESDTLTFLVTDDSGIDSVWWTLNTVFMAAAVSSADGATYTIPFTLSSYGENIITLHAKDASASGTEGSQSVTLNYNTKPDGITLVAPAADDTDVSTLPTLTWSGGDDADNDGVSFTVHYGTSETSLEYIAAVTGKTATISSVLAYNNTYYWQVTATSSSTDYPDEITSAIDSFITGGAMPTITTPPQSQTKEEGQSVTFKVTASANGFGDLTYQWRENGQYVGTDSDTYTTPSVTTVMNGKSYDCVVTNDVGSATSTAATLTVTAIPTYKVTFWNENAVPKPADQNIKRDSTATKPTEIPIRDGYKFTGWYVEGSSHEFYFNQTPITGNLTIVAGWVEVYTVTYHQRDDETGSAPKDTNKYESYTDAPIKSNNGMLQKDGYKFLGWTVNEDGSGTVYTSGSIQIGLSDIHLYAKWEEIRYDITYSMQGGMGTHSNPTYYTPLKVVTFTDASKDGYIFNGWYDSQQYQNKITSTQGLNRTITIYGRWLVAKGAVNYSWEISDYGTNNFTLNVQNSQGGYTDYSIKVEGHEISDIGYDVTFTTDLGCNPEVYYHNGTCSFHFTAITGPCQDSWGSYCSFVIYKSN